MQTAFSATPNRSSSPGCYSPISSGHYLPADKVVQELFSTLGKSIVDARFQDTSSTTNIIAIEFFAHAEPGFLTEQRVVIKISRSASCLQTLDPAAISHKMTTFDDKEKTKYKQMLAKLVGLCEQDRLVKAVLTQSEGISDLTDSKILQSLVIAQM